MAGILHAAFGLCAPFAGLCPMTHGHGGNVPSVAYAVAYLVCRPPLLWIKEEAAGATYGEHKWGVELLHKDPILILSHLKSDGVKKLVLTLEEVICYSEPFEERSIPYKMVVLLDRIL